MPDDINQTPLPGGVDVAPAGSGGSVADTVTNQVKDVLSQALNKPFPTNEAALKAVQDTFSAVGWAGKYKPYVAALQAKYGGEAGALKFMEQLVNGGAPATPATAPIPSTDQNSFVSKEQYEADMYFAGHPDLAEARPVIEAMKAKSGKSLAEVVDMPEMKSLLTKAKGYDDAEKTKSVLHTSPRIGQVTDKVTQSRQALKEGNREAAIKSALGAIADANDGL